MDRNILPGAIAKVQQRIDSISIEKAADLNRALDMGMMEYVKFQELKSVAVTDNTLSLEEAQEIYKYLGNTPDHFNAQPLAVKVVLTEIYMMLMKKQMGLAA